MKKSERMRVNPKFKRMVKIGASMSDMNITDFTGKIADDLEYNLQNKGLDIEKDEKKFKKFKFTF